MLTNEQIKGSMEIVIRHDDGTDLTRDILETLNEVLAWRERYPNVKLTRQRWDTHSKKFVDPH